MDAGTGYLFTRGKLINAEIDNLPTISGETSLGWLVHYLVGIGYAVVYFSLREIGWLDNSFIAVQFLALPQCLYHGFSSCQPWAKGYWLG